MNVKQRVAEKLLASIGYDNPCGFCGLGSVVKKWGHPHPAAWDYVHDDDCEILFAVNNLLEDDEPAIYQATDLDGVILETWTPESEKTLAEFLNYWQRRIRKHAPERLQRVIILTDWLK